jgi:sRNA-binding regulator protein Hfq
VSTYRRRYSTLLDNRFEGRSIELYVLNGERIMGLVDEVSANEIGILAEGIATIVPRNAVLYIITGLSDIHGFGECCESEYVLDEDFIGSDITVKLMNGEELSGRLIKITKNEIGVAQGNRALVIPRNSILYIKIVRR